MDWIKDVFKTEKPVIAMCHFRALPGDPYYGKEGGMLDVLRKAEQDLDALQIGGVDAVMFSNEFSMPYLTKVRPETVAAMSRIIGQLIPSISVPYGVNCLWDPIASLDVAAATDASFVREIFSGVYASDFGLWNTNAGEAKRHQVEIGAENVKLLYNIVPEAAVYLGDRSITSIAKTTVFNCHPDVLLVSGATAGVAADPEVIKTVKSATNCTPVFANTGCRIDTIENILEFADGAVVGTAFKYDGVFENQTDKNRVKEFMDIVHRCRK